MKFFRRFRWQSLPDTKFTRYLLYATGEIVLVVIGILLALQINSWNESRKINDSIRGHLSILKQNLLEDQEELALLYRQSSENVIYADSVLRQIRTEIPVSNDAKKFLIKLILEYRFKPNTNAMDMLAQSNELPYLSTKLQTAILNYYKLIEDTQEREHISNTQIQSKYENHINEHYSEIFQKDNSWEFIQQFYASDPRTPVPLDNEKLISDGKLEAMILSRYFQNTQLKDFYSDLLTSTDELIVLLDERS